ncbi:hypothetical protein CHS0354_038828, partial [Potamilus streckersoni]
MQLLRERPAFLAHRKKYPTIYKPHLQPLMQTRITSADDTNVLRKAKHLGSCNPQ